jgi:hypothetical protein
MLSGDVILMMPLSGGGLGDLTAPNTSLALNWWREQSGSVLPSDKTCQPAGAELFVEQMQFHIKAKLS